MTKLRKANETGVTSSDGWSVQVVAPEVMEYRDRGDVTVLNVGFDPATREIVVEASGVSDKIRANVAEAVKLLKGNWVVT